MHSAHSRPKTSWPACRSRPRKRLRACCYAPCSRFETRTCTCPTDTTRQYWTLPHVPGKQFVGKDVYILTSHRTLSGAEEFSYKIRNLKLATLVGETTGGGAHPGGRERLANIEV